MKDELMKIAEELGIAIEYKTIRLNGGEVKEVKHRVNAEHMRILEAAYKAGMLAEREACAKLCEAYIAPSIGKEIAAAIRGRTE